MSSSKSISVSAEKLRRPLAQASCAGAFRLLSLYDMRLDPLYPMPENVSVKEGRFSRLSSRCALLFEFPFHYPLEHAIFDLQREYLQRVLALGSNTE